MNDELERRIQRALDAGELTEDADLLTKLRADPEAFAFAQELREVDAQVRAWGARQQPQDGGDLAVRVGARLDEALPPLPCDPLAPPDFDDSFDDSEGEVGPERGNAASVSARISAPVDLASRRRARAGWWVAAAAVVGLAAVGAIVGSRPEASPQEGLAMAPAAEESYAVREPVGELPGPGAREPMASSGGSGESRTLQAEATPFGADGVVGAADAVADGVDDLEASGAGAERVRRRRRPARRRALRAITTPGASRRRASVSSHSSSARTRERLRACMGRAAPRVLELVAVVAGQHVVEVRAPGLSAETRECLRRALRGERFDASSGGRQEVRLRYRLRD